MQKLIRSLGTLVLAGLSFIALPTEGMSQAKDAKVKRALQQLELGATRQAIDELKAIIAESPKSAEAHAALALAYLQNNQIEQAATTAQIAFDLDRKAALARIARAKVYGRQGDHKGALKEFEQAAKLDDKEIAIPLALAQYYLSIDSIKPAEIALYQALGKNDKDVRPYLVLGELYEKQRTRELAITQYEEAKKLDPNDVTVRAKLAGLYYRTRQYNESIKEWIELTKIDESFSEAFYQIGYLYFLADQNANAAKAFKTYTEKEPNDIKGHWMYARALTENNQFQQALPALEKVSQNDSLKKESELLLAKSYTFSKEYDKAINIYKARTQMAPADYDAYARALVMVKDTAGSIAQLKKAIVDDTDRTEAAQLGTQKLLTGLLTATKRYSEAADVFNQILLKNPTAENYSALAYIYSQEGNLDKGREAYDKALEKAPNNLSILMAIGGMYAKDPTDVRMKDAYQLAATEAEKVGNKDVQGQAEFRVGHHYYSVKDYATAVPRLLKATTLIADNAVFRKDLYLLLAVSYHQQQDLPNAKKWYQKVLEVDPSNKTAKDMLEKIK